ncbi:hypothetical protein E4U13_007266 [Claviceps humidiphila]|uniref:Protein SSH4 n=1 Tax=Claviceps humidiphila TaxID=1294629 RepID=A0A9P7TYT4_9HYPO|nr:hypothetical protein E4U13_007266 [Claviceps humidiphila]
MDERAGGGVPLDHNKGRLVMTSISGGFDDFLGSRDSDLGSSKPGDPFFVPSHLSSSNYIRKLAKEHEAKILRAAKESKLSPTASRSAPRSSDFTQPRLPAGSHRGISHSVVERPSLPEEISDVPPLPSRWNKDDLWGSIEVHSDGQSVEYTGSRSLHDRDQEAAVVRADHHMPSQCGLYYFEVSIVHGRRDDTNIAIGFSTKNAATSRPIGWEADCVGYHGDDGRCFTGSNAGQSYGPEFNTGDVIGCGVNFLEHTAFFTKNGVNLGTVSPDVTRDKIYPAVSLRKPREHIMVNFGQNPFVFDIDNMMNEQRNKIQAEIQSTDASILEPGMGETDLIHALILQFLQHDGYVETARAFAEDIKEQKEALNLDPNVTIEGINIRDDKDAHNRQRIRKSILDGDIDSALKLTNKCYPQVLHDNEVINFKLRCRKFIELVRLAAQMRAEAELKKRNELLSSEGGTALDMDIDDDDDDEEEDESWAWKQQMNAETAEQALAKVTVLEQEMLQYGQTLGARYADDAHPEFSKTLAEIWSLVAYSNPLKEPKVSHLLDRKGRVVVAEELNACILSSLGKSSCASLEKLYAQTCVLLDEVGQDGGPGAFISAQDVVRTAWDFVSPS